MKYLIIEYSGEKYYAFNLLDDVECFNAIGIIQDKLEFMVMVWKVARAIPWVLGFSDWKDFMISIKCATNQADGKMHADVHVNANNDENGWNKEEIEQAQVESADPLYVGDGVFQGDVLKSNGIGVVNKLNEESAHATMHNQAVSNNAQVSNPYENVKFESQARNTKFDADGDVFDLCGGNFTEDLASNISKSTKSNMLDVYVTGPFINGKTGKSHYVVVFGAFLKAWPLKDSFLRGYLHTLANKMNSVKNSKIDTNHCHSYRNQHMKE
jgi:hypothetical protein